MNKKILAAIIMFASLSASAQVYVSASSGYSFKAVESKMGTKTSLSGVENTYGSYGEGTHTQVRAGYFFNDKWGIEAAAGYLYGADQTAMLVEVPGQPYVDVKARGRAFGLSLSTVYNITEHFYGRAGVLTKIGGKTEVVGKVKTALPTPVGTTIPLEIDFTRDFKGKFPLGFIGAIGYKHEILKNLSVFAEAEYLGISVTRNTSEIGDFSATLNGNNVSREALLKTVGTGLGALSPLINDKISYEDSLTLVENAQAQQNPLATKQLSQTVPYSSWGFNFGFTYTFNKRK
ncbi:outer membrane beta-barrel protein [Tenacibaculum finnmarkense]|uniref:outer membrane beta-barrel protein n=1 Tax=Tenacibaculum finnmarkense TaxID=2781243 RepID=UPI003BB778E7